MPLQHACPRLSDHASYQGEELLDLLTQALGDLLTSSTQCLAHSLALVHYLFRRLHQVLIQLTLLGELFFPRVTQKAMQPLGHGASAGQVALEESRSVFPRLGKHRLGPLHDAREDAHTVDQEPTIGGMMDSRWHTGGIDPQLAPAGHPRLHCQLYHALIQCLQRFGTDEPAPADEGGIVRHAAEVNPAEPAQHETIGHALLRFLEAPVVEMFDEQQTQDGLHRRGMASPVSRVGKAPRQIRLDLLEELIIIEQDIEGFELRVGLPRQFGHRRKHIFWRIAVNEHRTFLLSKLLRRFYRLICSEDKLNQLRPLLTPASTSIGSTRSPDSGDTLALEPLPRLISHRKLVLVCGAKWIRGPEKPIEAQQLLA